MLKITESRVLNQLEFYLICISGNKACYHSQVNRN